MFQYILNLILKTNILLFMLMIPVCSSAEFVESEFRPHPLLISKHAQTIWTSAFKSRSRVQYRRQRLELEDGDFLDLDWFQGNQQSQNLVVLIHGLGGSSASNYIKRIGRELSESKFRVVVFNLRGATEPNRLPRTYHSGETSDLNYVINYLSETEAPEKMFIAGFSLGGNMLLKWLGENKGQELVNKAVAVSVPFDLSAVANRLNEGGSRIYRYSLLKNMQRVVRKKQTLLGNSIDLNRAYNAKTFHEFDDAVTAPLNGFVDVHEYYKKSSSRQFLKLIDTQTLVVQSRDDPFVPLSAIPGESELGKWVRLELSNRGGHVGFIGRGRGLSIRYWLPMRIMEFFSKD